MNYRRPAGPSPYRTGNHAGPLAGLCAIVIVCGMILLSLLALDRAAQRSEVLPAAHHHQLYAEVER